MSRIKTSLIFLLCLILFTGCSMEDKQSKTPEVTENGVKMVARTAERYIEVYAGGNWERLLVKGVNIGTALPGRWFTEFPANKRVYLEWFDQITGMNANTIRVYTLMDPVFYESLYEFNQRSGGPKLWLLQEIWPDEEVPKGNLYDQEYLSSYRKEMSRVIDAIHGNGDIPERLGRAWGKYQADVSSYLSGYLVGRELLPEEVHSTNEANKNKQEYRGDYVKAFNASASEVWLADMCNYVISYSVSKYSWQVPVAFVSWPTLDPIEHDISYEQGKDSNDIEEINPAHLSAGPKSIAGLFGAYHIYPNYPDFIYRDPRYAKYHDEQGLFRYGGYLKHFIEIHPPYPALIAEFGMSTSLNTAHIHPEGLNHGGVSEKQQGEMIARMMRSIVKEGYAGGNIFEWADEWAKKTWNTEPFMIPYERHIFWHNVMDPEQNYGILACEPPFNPISGQFELVWRGESDENSILSALYAKADAAYLFLQLELNGQKGLELLDKQKQLELTLAIDTFNRTNGTTVLPVDGLPALPSGAEFLLRFSSGGACLLTRPDYNRANLKFSTTLGKDVTFFPVNPLVNRRQFSLKDGSDFPEIHADESKLYYGNFNPDSPEYSSLSHWFVDNTGKRVYIRIPWLLLNVSDPSSNLVLYDKRFVIPESIDGSVLRDQIGVKKTDGFLFYAAITKQNNLLDFQPRVGDTYNASERPYLWSNWDLPSYRMRLKQSYQLVSKVFSSID